MVFKPDQLSLKQPVETLELAYLGLEQPKAIRLSLSCRNDMSVERSKSSKLTELS